MDETWMEPTPEARIMPKYRSRPQIQWEPLIDLDVPKAFVKLPAAELEFRRQAQRLTRSASTDVLFHAAWLQPASNPDTAVPIILDSAAPQGEYPELQGSIRIYSRRYLHVESQLWLNTAGGYLDRHLVDQWSTPTPPLAPRKEDGAAFLFDLRATPFWLEPRGYLPAPFEGLRIAPFRLFPGKPFIEPLLHKTQAPLWSFTLSAQGDSAMLDAHDADPALAEWLQRPSYSYRHAVLLEQRRRMRSDELHYIDHPMFGIIIRASRLEFEPYWETEPEIP